MTQSCLVLRVHWHEPRYHGVPDWPPSPARLFQALVAGAAVRLNETPVREALLWLEGQDPPIIGAPRHKAGQAVKYFVPNNDLDAKGGDPGRVADLRVEKVVQPRILDPGVPALYVWPCPANHQHARMITEIAQGLSQLGRGLDMAWAVGEIREVDELATVWDGYDGVIHRPAGGGTARRRLRCPCRGTLASLAERFAAQSRRFVGEGRGKKRREVFVQPPKAITMDVAYDGAPSRYVFELRPDGVMDRLGAIPAEHIVAFTERLRDQAVARLRQALSPTVDSATVDATLIGRRPGEDKLIPIDLRIRIVPLPSIGHEHVDPRVRRILVEVPQGGPIRAADVRWAFSNANVDGNVLIDSPEDGMLQHYTRPSRRWQSITPVALPASRRRIEPSRRSEEVKPAAERAAEEARAARDLMQALRHAKVDARVVHVDVRREPCRRTGSRAEAFGTLPRFPKERLWHVDLVFDRPVAGPLVVGDGRFLGLGVLAPSAIEMSVHCWRIVDGLVSGADPTELTMALRRAVMALAQDAVGRSRRLPDWVSGHARDGRPAEGHEHLHFVFDEHRQRLLVIDPLKGRGAHASQVLAALDSLSDLRAGRAGRLSLRKEVVPPDDLLLARARTWRTLTPYRVQRHGREGRDAMIERDVIAACVAEGLPKPRVKIRAVRSVRGKGVDADLDLEFGTPIAGPVLLGRTRHLGGGVLAATPHDITTHATSDGP